MVQVRKATGSDSRDLWEWRNDPATRAASLSSDAVAWEKHVEWFDKTLAHPQRAIYIGEAPSGETGNVGMCRFDIDPSAASAEVSINLNPAHRGKRLSKELLAASIDEFRSDFTTVTQVTALIRESNEPSKKLFASVGFSRVSETDGVGAYVLSLAN